MVGDCAILRMALLARGAPSRAACAQQMRAPAFGIAWQHAAAGPCQPLAAARPALHMRKRAGPEFGAGLCTRALRQPAHPERRRCVRAHASWGAEPEWQACPVASTVKAAEGLVQLHLDIGALAEAYTKPGQCVQVVAGGCT